MALSQALNPSRKSTNIGAAGLNIIHEAADGSKDQRNLNDIAVREFHDALSKSSDVAVAVAAIRALTTVIRNSAAQTIMGLSKELEEAAQALQRSATCMHACAWVCCTAVTQLLYWYVHGCAWVSALHGRPEARWPMLLLPFCLPLPDSESIRRPCPSRPAASSSCATRRAQVHWSCRSSTWQSHA